MGPGDHLVLEFVEPLLERQENRQVQVDDEPRQAHRERVDPAASVPGSAAVSVHKAIGAGRDIRVPGQQKARADEDRNLDRAEVEVLRFGVEPLQQHERVVAEVLELRRVPLALRVLDRQRMQAECLLQKPGFGIQGHVPDIEPEGRPRVAAPSLDLLLAALGLGRGVGVCTRACGYTRPPSAPARVRARALRRRRRCAVAFAVIVEEDGPRRDETRRTAPLSRAMARIEDYALIGDMQTAALVGDDGSIDWLCLPRFDSGACFAALLGDAATTAAGRSRRPAPCATRHAPLPRRRRWCSRPSSRPTSGTVRVDRLHAAAPGRARPGAHRRRRRGEVAMRMELVIRFDYGSIVPWVRTTRRRAARDRRARTRCRSATPVATQGRRTDDRRRVHGRGPATACRSCCSGIRRTSPAAAAASTRSRPSPDTEAWWREWSRPLHVRRPLARGGRCDRSITLKALTYAPTGGIVAAATTSLPEQIGGVRNWDYRYCWLRDATFTLYALIAAATDEAAAWRDWLLRAVAGDPAQMQIMYGAGGRAAAAEIELPWLPGYEGSRAGARRQRRARRSCSSTSTARCMDALHLARRAGLDPDDRRLGAAAGAARLPRDGLARARRGHLGGARPRRHFTHSKVMAWVAFDRGVKAVERFGRRRAGRPLARPSRRGIHAEVCARGFDADAEHVHAVLRLAANSTPACSCCRSSASCRADDRACSAPSRRSSAS